MFIGHFAVGFAAKPAVPRLSLAVLFAAAQLADLLWPLLVALGVESVRIAPGDTAFTPLQFISYPWSHSLLLLLVWGVMFGVVVRTRRGNGNTILVLTALVLSHWLLDFMTHRSDMPLYPGGPKFGLGLWNSVRGTIAVELLMFAVGVWIYVRFTRPRDAIGRWALVSFVIVLLAIYAASAAGPPPPSVGAIVVVGVAGGALLLLWSWWFDRHRMPKG